MGTVELSLNSDLLETSQNRNIKITIIKILRRDDAQ